jgi:hypothetical protein
MNFFDFAVSNARAQAAPHINKKCKWFKDGDDPWLTSCRNYSKVFDPKWIKCPYCGKDIDQDVENGVSVAESKKQNIDELLNEKVINRHHKITGSLFERVEIGKNQWNKITPEDAVEKVLLERDEIYGLKTQTLICVNPGRIEVVTGEARSADVEEGDVFTITDEDAHRYYGELKIKGDFVHHPGLSGKRPRPGFVDARTIEFAVQKNKIDVEPHSFWATWSVKQ